MSSVPPAPAFIVRLVLSYVAGTVLAPLLRILPDAPGNWENLSLLGAISGLSFVAALSFMFSFKYFLIALVLALVFRPSISNHLLIWCAASVAGVPVLWLTEVYLRESRGEDLLVFLKNTGNSALVVCYYVLVYAAVFYVWNRAARGRAPPGPGQKA